MVAKTLWEQFHIDTPDSGKSLIDCLTYNSTQLTKRQQFLINSLRSRGVEMHDSGQSITVSLPKKLTDSERARSIDFLTRLSDVNGSLEYNEVGFGNYRSLYDLKNGMMASYLFNLKQRNLPEAYDFVTLVIPGITQDLMNSPSLSETDKIQVEELADFARRQAKFLDKGGVIMGT